MKLNFKKLRGATTECVNQEDQFSEGLIPAIVQDSSTMQVLMLGFMNEEAYKKTIQTGKVTFWSRERKCIWQKGETSGNFLEVTEIKKDCDNDSLLILANPKGPTCHTGKYSCFGNKEPNALFLKELFSIIKSRKEKMPKNSYTTSLFEKGINEIVKKVGEESVEVIIAAKSESRKRVIEESGDLLYHLLVLLAEKEIDLEEVIKELTQKSPKFQTAFSISERV